MVRLAFVGSVAWTSPPVSTQISQVSTVPKSSSPASARSRAPATLSKIQRILLAEKYASGRRPVFARTMAATCASPHSSSTSPAVRRHCHTMAFITGCPVEGSHTMVVSRWLSMPMESMSLADSPCLAMSSVRHPSCEKRISCGLCSTQPGCGKICWNGRCTQSTIRPSRSMSTARELVVPWSSAMTYFAALPAAFPVAPIAAPLTLGL